MAQDLNNVSEMIDTAIDKSMRLKEGVLKAEWEKIVGKICEKCQPEYIKDGVLYIRVESPVFIHHLTFEKNKYIEKVNKYFCKKVIKDIVVKTGKLSEIMNEYLDREKEEVIIEKKAKLKEDEIAEELENVALDGNNIGIMQKITYLRELAIEREKYLLANGYKKCKVCGMLYEGEENFCRVCLDTGEAKKFLKGYERSKSIEDSEE